MNYKHQVAGTVFTAVTHSIGMCRMRRFLAVIRSFFHSSLLRIFSCQPSPPNIRPSSLTSSCHLFLGLPLNLVVPKFIYNTPFGIPFPSVFCTCSHQSQFPAQTPPVSSRLDSPLQLCLTQPHILLSTSTHHFQGTPHTHTHAHARLFRWDTHIWALPQVPLSHIPLWAG